MDPEFDDVVAVEDLMALERRYAAELQQGAPSRQCRFEYGWGLVRSRYREDTARGVALLSELLPETPAEEQRDVLFYLALGCYRLKVTQVTRVSPQEYERALEHLERLLVAEPQNAQVQRLRSRVRSRLRRDGLVGAAIVGGVVMGVAGLVGVAIARARQ
ncbi:mitochondrial fission 1 protein isoform X1 [Melospiza melodia melodia]|uniref:mitochondrial fission 1 protein isoform X1 n=1 Tax=Melospiza melodia melodia TaxID=1914991 RepID=UPI002FD4EFB4